MNKNDLIDAVSAQGGFSRADATKAIDTALTIITSSLKGGDEVRLVGFGTFLVSQRAATKGRDPRTGAPIDIPASRVPKFKAGKALKEAVN